MTDFGILAINKLIVHEVPKHLKTGGSSPPVYSEIESPLNAELSRFFRGKIVDTVESSGAFGVYFDDASSSIVPSLVKHYLADTGDFVTVSQEIAKHLYDCQTGLNPGGLLTVVDCQFNVRKAIAILKVEKEEGVRLNQSTVGGKVTFDISYVKNLLFTKNTKLFKIGMFIEPETGKDIIEGIVCDHQRGFSPTAEVAKFFLHGFLGCRLRQDPAVSTNRFYETAESFINEAFENPVDRAKLHSHLFSEVSSERTVINPNVFANDFLPTPVRQRFMNKLQENDVPTTTFDKNLELVQDRIKRVALRFASGITMVGSNDAIQEKVTIEKCADGTAKVQVVDRLEQIKSK